MTDRVGFIGLGRMGRPMAANLQRKGVRLTVFDVVATPMAVLVQLGARRTASLAGVTERSDVVVTMLPGSPEVEEVVLGPDGVLAHGRPGMLVMDMSTVDPATTDALAAAAAQHDASVVSVDQQRCFPEAGVVVDLLHEEVSHARARDFSHSPLVSIDEHAVGSGSRPARQQARTGDHPVERAVADDLFLHILVVVDAPQQKRKQDGTVKKAALIAAVASADPGHAD